MKIGIFLGYDDSVKLSNEGLGHFLADFLEIVSKKNEVVLAYPSWLQENLECLFDDYQINTQQISSLVEDRIPIILRLYHFMIRRKKKKRFALKNFSFFQILKEFFIQVLLSTNVVQLCLSLIAFCFIILLVAAPVVVFFLLLALFLCLRHIFFYFRKIVKKLVSAILQLKWIRGQFGEIEKNARNILQNELFAIYANALIEVRKNLVHRINSSNIHTDIWYAPALFWPEFNDIRGNKIVVSPDLVMLEFPIQWGEFAQVKESFANCNETILGANFFMTYCRYIKKTLIEEHFGKRKENIWVIPHRIHDVSHFTTLVYDNGTIINKKTMESRIVKDILNTLKPYVIDVYEYIADFCFDDIRYIFYASQGRPHKNILNLIKAYEYLLRHKYVNVKLFLTMNWNLKGCETVKDYIYKKNLQHDVIAFSGVSMKGLAALYHEADLVVNPTLYEGGFPYTFGEGMSVGVPSVMSDIPQVREFTDAFDLEDMLFDPYDYKDMADRIEYGLSHREELIEKEKPLYEWMKKEFSQERLSDMYQEMFETVRKAG